MPACESKLVSRSSRKATAPTLKILFQHCILKMWVASKAIAIVVTTLGLGGLCSILHPLCYSNMLKIVPTMPKIMPQICLLCSNYAHGHALFLEGANLYVQTVQKR